MRNRVVKYSTFDDNKWRLHFVFRKRSYRNDGYGSKNVNNNRKNNRCNENSVRVQNEDVKDGNDYLAKHKLHRGPVLSQSSLTLACQKKILGISDVVTMHKPKKLHYH